MKWLELVILPENREALFMGLWLGYFVIYAVVGLWICFEDYLDTKLKTKKA